MKRGKLGELMKFCALSLGCDPTQGPFQNRDIDIHTVSVIRCPFISNRSPFRSFVKTLRLFRRRTVALYNGLVVSIIALG